MSFDLLLEQFDKSVRTPTDLEKLRAAILDWAIRGLLNTQNPNDDPVDALIERIMSQRQAMIVVNGNVKPKNISPIKPSEIPYKLPENWRWVRLPAVYYTHGQKKPDRTFTYIDVSSIDNERGVIGPDLQVIEAKNAPSRARKQVAPGTVIYSTVRPYLLNIAIVEQEYDPKPIISTAFAVMHPFQGVLNKYLFYYLRSPSFTTFVEGQMTGMAYPAISDSKLNKGLFPLPPFEEQKRIVARVKQLRAHAYELASRLDTAESQRKKFHTSAIHRLTEAKTPQETGAAWHLIRDNFDRLYTEPQTIDELKQAILQLAVMGRLVPQDPNDEPADRLLQVSKIKKDGLLHAGKISRRKPVEPLSDSDLAFEVPTNWQWTKLDYIADIAGGVTKGRKLSQFETIYLPYLRVANVQRGYLDLEVIKTIEIKADELDKYSLQYGDLLLTEGGDADKLGRSAIWCGEIEDCIHQNHVFRARPLSERLNMEWLMLCTNSFYGKDYFLSASKQTTNLASINMTQLRNFPAALPPITEQERILAKVEQLLTVCDQLEEQSLSAKNQRTKLLNSILAAAR